MSLAVMVAIGAYIAGAVLLSAGVHLLAGLGWALVSGAAFCLVLAGVILRGLRG